ncbi:MAG TPA: recombinase family protein [Verrucomicrobiae bacterium]|nr:recombinase family protein [Verrucomicrobiae bacterium]
MAEAAGDPVVGYVRVSTEEQGDLGAGLEAQRQAILTTCRARGWRLLGLHEDVASGKALANRPGLEAALATVRRGEAGGLVVAKLDRLSRSVIDAAQTIERARQEGWNLVALDLGVDFSTAAGTAMAQMTAVFAELERRLIGERTRAALAVKRAQGVRLGRPPEVTPDTAATILRLHRAHWTATKIARHLEAEGVPAPRGGPRWHVATVARLIARTGGRLRRGRPPRPRGARPLS